MQIPKFPEITKAFEWLILEKDDGRFLSSDELCQTRDVFQARLDRLFHGLSRNPQYSPLSAPLSACVGELGNNAFDHNLGKWKDQPGIFFVHDLARRFIFVADRGQGVFSSLKRVKKDIKDEQEAIDIAFTKIISGRSPEHRGNGLKFVAGSMKRYGFSLFFQSGTGKYQIPSKRILSFPMPENLPGTFAVIFF